MKAQLAALALLSAAACGSAGTAAPPPKGSVAVAHREPLKLVGRVVDAARIIADDDEQRLVKQLAALESATSDQIVVVTVPSLHGDTIERYSIALANRWGIGRADVDNGVIVLVAPLERKVRIEVGLGLEGLLTDAKAKEVIAAMLPRLSKSDFGGGLRIGVDAIDQLLRSDRRRPQPKPEVQKEAA